MSFSLLSEGPSIRRPTVGVSRLSFLEGLPSLNGSVLKPPRTYFVSLGKTRLSSAEMLISGTLRVGGGSPQVGAQFFVR